MQRKRSQSILGFAVLGVLASPALAQVAPLPPLPMPGESPAVAAPAPAMPSPLPAMPAPTPPAAPNAGPAPSVPAAAAAPALPVLPEVPVTTSQPTADNKSSISNVLSGMAQRSVSAMDTGVSAEGEAPKVYSFGTSSISLLFLPTQIERMKQAYRTYEDTAKDAKTTTFVEQAPTVVAPTETIAEPASYPVFYLASIAYDSPRDWSVWVSGHKITSKKNDTDLNVVRVAPDSVTFTWQPTYSNVLAQRNARDLFAPVDPVKNKLSAAQNVSIDEGTRTVTFTLRQNQSFAVGYFSTFEGFVESPKVPVMTAAPAFNAPLTSGDPMAVNGQPQPGDPNQPDNSDPSAQTPPPVVQLTPPKF